MRFIEKYPEVTEMRSLSWNQPFCSLMIHGKDETRKRKTNVRGWVLMCAAQKAYAKNVVYQIAGSYEQYMRIVKTIKSDQTARINGSAICVGNLIDSRPMQPEDEDKAFVGYDAERHLWIFKDVQVIKPIPFKGKQGWGILDQNFINSIELV